MGFNFDDESNSIFNSLKLGSSRPLSIIFASEASIQDHCLFYLRIFSPEETPESRDPRTGYSLQLKENHLLKLPEDPRSAVAEVVLAARFRNFWSSSAPTKSDKDTAARRRSRSMPGLHRGSSTDRCCC